MFSLKGALHSSLHSPGYFGMQIIWHNPQVYNPIWGALCTCTRFLFSHCFVAVTSFEMNNHTAVTEFIFLGFSNHSTYRDCSSWSSQSFTWQLSWEHAHSNSHQLIVTTLHTLMNDFPRNLSLLDTYYVSTTNSVCTEHSTCIRPISARHSLIFQS